MPDLAAEVHAFIQAYADANNSHDITRVAPMIAKDAVYWFTDGSYQGIDQITGAISRTFATIQDEIYEITDLDWIVLAPSHAAGRSPTSI